MFEWHMYQARGVPTTSRSLPARKVATRSISWLARNSLRLNAPASRYTSGRCARVRTTTSSPAWASGSAGSDSFGVQPTRNPPCNGNNSPSATTPDSGTSSEYPHGVFAGSLLNQRCQRNGEFRWIAPSATRFNTYSAASGGWAVHPANTPSSSHAANEAVVALFI
jgi:hypothetical protein